MEKIIFHGNIWEGYMKIQQAIINGQQVIPAFELQVSVNEIVGIQTNVQRKKALLKQFNRQKDIYFSYSEQGEYLRLKVQEFITFLKNISGNQTPVHRLIEIFQLQEVRKDRMEHLPLSKKMYISLLRVYFAHHETIVLEEPCFYLEDYERILLKRLLEELAQTKKIIILTSNLEDALVCCDKIYRLDEIGLNLLDIADSEDQSKEEVAEESFKIQKIPTKKDDKVILFNPPEIDYIESINSAAVVHVGSETYNCTMTLTELETRLLHYGFFRCHRSYIVNLQKVREIITWTKNSYSLRLNVGKESVVPLSRTKLVELKGLLNI